jgi:Uma2 family endonuclease
MAMIAPARFLRDPTIYPTKDDMGEGSLQRFIAELLRPLVERWLAAKGKLAFVGADQFVYWKQFDTRRQLAPDILVLPGVPPGSKVDSWKIWETGIVPSFALEVVSGDEYLKDYRDGPPFYDEMGVRELCVFDPEYQAKRSERLRFQVFRRLSKRGLVRVEATNEDRVRSRILGCHLRAVGEDLGSTRLRLASGPSGEALFPTEGEARAEAEAALAASEAEVARLRAELRRLRGK